MAFPPYGACSFFQAGVAPPHHLCMQGYPLEPANGKPNATRVSCAEIRGRRILLCTMAARRRTANRARLTKQQPDLFSILL
jgi:hypothetical protein